MTQRDPEDALHQYCLNMDEHSAIQNSMEQWLFKFSGGRPEDTIADILKEQETGFDELLNYIDVNSKELLKDHPDLARFIPNIEEGKKAFVEGQSEILRLMNENNQGGPNWNGIKDFRETVKIGSIQLNNIKSPDILKKYGLRSITVSTYETETSNLKIFSRSAQTRSIQIVNIINTKKLLQYTTH